MRRSLIAVGVLLAAAALASCGGAGPAAPFGDAAAGRDAFVSTCATCHGPDALGITGLGKNLTTSSWVGEQTDEQLLAFLLIGRPSGDPLNTTGIDMPPKGGNPALTEQDLKNIVAYLRTIHQ